jgi:alkaline phosphatase
MRRVTAITTLSVFLAGSVIGYAKAPQEQAPFNHGQMHRPGRRHRQAPPTHVILIIGDGMQLHHEIAASRYLTGANQALAWHAFPAQTYCTTWDVTTYNAYANLGGYAPFSLQSVDASVGYDIFQGGTQPDPWQAANLSYFNPGGALWPATDSASAATALATGYKTDDGNIAWLSGDPDSGGNRVNDGSLRTIAEIARQEQDLSIGVVTTVPFNHATPAGFVSHNKSRNNYFTGKNGYTGMGIADEIITVTKPDVVIGGGHPDWDTGYLGQSQMTTLRSSGDYVVAERRAGVDGAETLSSAAAQAVASGKKLFGVFGGKGGNFEYHVPQNAPGAPSVSRGTIENPELKDAATAALDVLSQNPNGFFLMIEQGDIDWANHANAYANMLGCMHDLNETVKTVVDYVERPGDDINWSNTLVMVTSDHGNSYMRLNSSQTLGLGELPSDLSGYVSYGTTGHTNELVTFAAKGPWKALRQLGGLEGRWYNAPLVDNTQVFHLMATFIGEPKASPLKVKK